MESLENLGTIAEPKNTTDIKSFNFLLYLFVTWVSLLLNSEAHNICILRDDDPF